MLMSVIVFSSLIAGSGVSGEWNVGEQLSTVANRVLWWTLNFPDG
jgi:hypothetical protein